MSKVQSSVSACRHCRFYQIQGRRGGLCEQLGAPVQGAWTACSLALCLFMEMEPVAQSILTTAALALHKELGAEPLSDSRLDTAIACETTQPSACFDAALETAIADP